MSSYTRKIYEGEPQDLRSFALDAARAMGPTVELREASADTPLTSENVKNRSRRHSALLAEANRQLDWALALTDDEATKLADTEFERQRAAHQQFSVGRHAVAGRAKAMLEEVENWQPPTESHAPLQDFMRSQLGQLIADSGYRNPAPVKQTGKEYRDEAIDAAWREIGTRTDQQVRQTLHNFDRAEWVDALHDSLPENGPVIPEPVSPIWENAR